jgi:predicted DNA repair protein MutK
VRGDFELKEPVMAISRRLVQVQHIALLAASLVLVALLIAMPLWG